MNGALSLHCFAEQACSIATLTHNMQLPEVGRLCVAAEAER